MQDSYYFSHDYNARDELQEVLMKLGHEGKSVYWDLIEQLHEQGGYLALDKIETLAFTSRTTPDLIKKLISKEFGLFEQDKEKFWSISVLRRIEKRKEIAKIRSINGYLGAQKRWHSPKKAEKNNQPYKKITDISFVNLTEPDYKKLVQKYGELQTTLAINVLETWLGKKGSTAKQYIGKNHYSHFRKDSWVWQKVNELSKNTTIPCDYVN